MELIAIVILRIGHSSKNVIHDFNIINKKALNSAVLFTRTSCKFSNRDTGSNMNEVHKSYLDSQAKYFS